MASIDPVRWGIVGTARIVRTRMAAALRSSEWCELSAIASRSPEAAAAAAAELGVPRAYGSYAELLADARIEAVYVPLPNHLHVETTLQALSSGKHVLCEKPIAMSAAQAARLRGAGAGLLVAEAVATRFHPQWITAREMIRAGRIGTPHAIHMFYGIRSLDPANIRNRAETGGGVLRDLGVYPIVCGRFMFEAEPRRVIALLERDSAFGVERLASALLDFGAGRRLSFTVCSHAAPSQRTQIFGSLARLEIEVTTNAPADREMRLVLDDGNAAESVMVPAADQYELQVSAFARAVRGLAPLPYGLEDAIANMRVLDALLRSEASGRWEEP